MDASPASTNAALASVLLIALLATTNVILRADEPRATTTLKEVAAGRFLMGVGVSHTIADRPSDWPLLTSQFEIITPENCIKPAAVQPAEGRFNFADADRFVRWAQQHDLQIAGHCLVWARDDNTPQWWLTEDGQQVSPTRLMERLEKHIEAVAGRYGSRVAMWDVVNEALADGEGGYLRDSIWSRTTGDRFIAKAFQFARQQAPDALLIYNDYHCHLPAKREKLLRMLRSVEEQGGGIDAVGLQGHYELDDIPLDEIRATLEALRGLGLKVVISELDIDVIPRAKWWADDGKHRDEMSKLDPYRDGVPPEVLQRQAEQYASLFRLFAEYGDIVERVSFWNLHDGESWLNVFPWRRVNHPLLFDRDREPKPAYLAVVKALQQADSGSPSSAGE